MSEKVKKEVPQRIYSVLDGATGAEYLVSAVSKAAAVEHVAKGQYNCTLVSQQELMRLVAAGVEVQQSVAPKVATTSEAPAETV
jgi:hypothetical protein